MADRTWNAVDVDILRQPWSKCARRIGWQIMTEQPNQYGIFDTPLGALVDHWSDIYSEAQITDAINELVGVGVFRVYREGRLLWVVKKWKREQQNCNTWKQTLGLHRHLDKFPEVRDDFLAEYPTFIVAIEVAIKETMKATIKATMKDTLIVGPKSSESVSVININLNLKEDITTNEREILHELYSIKGWPQEYETDRDYIRKLAVEFPFVDILHTAKDLAVWHLDNPLKKNSRARSRLLTFCKKAKDFGRLKRDDDLTGGLEVAN